jgi:replication initiation protein RepC
LLVCSGPVSRRATLTALHQRRGDLATLRAEVETAYLDSISVQEMSANGCEYERHIQNSNTEQTYEKKEMAEPSREHEDSYLPADIESPEPQPKTNPVTLSQVLKICPKIADYSKSGINSWMDLYRSAFLVKSMLGVTPSAWENARQTMGDIPAAVTMAAMLERADDIHSAGGYLRRLTERAKAGKFPILPMLRALEKREINVYSTRPA